MGQCCCNSCHSHTENLSHKDSKKTIFIHEYFLPSVSFLMLITGMIMNHFDVYWFEIKPIATLWYLSAFLLVGIPVLKEAAESIMKKDFFNEFSLMSLASIGAFYIGEYPEAVGIMLFYCIGEMFQEKAVSRARKRISSLIDMRPDKASVIRNNKIEEVRPDEIKPGETIEVKAGERIALDGLLMDDEALFNTSALTGESIPRQINNGEEVAAGMISENKVVRLKVLRPASDSALSRILKMVEDASEKKAPSELLIRKLARIYTPIVTGLAILITLLPFLFSLINHSFNFIFDDWLYRSLFFLVLSCPCALVISIPLGYFGGIGAASKKGILFKGGNYLDAITKVNCVVFDKTGTLTRGVFEITSVNSLNNYSEEDVLKYAALAESKSTHPIATALLKYALSKGMIINTPRQITEKAGYGVETIINGNNILAGNIRLMELYNVSVPESLKQVDDTIICIAANNIMAGYILLADTLKEDSKDAVKELEKLNIKDLNILSGDKSSIVANIAVKLGIKSFKGDLLPAGKLEFTKDLKKDKNKVVAFVGDGINDAPVLALSDVGIAMGSMGSDAAIESADVVIQTDQPSKVAEAVKIGKLTKKIVYQNIIFAFGVKILVLLLGTMGIASLWEAVFADVGVSLIAILNALRLQNLMIKD